MLGNTATSLYKVDSLRTKPRWMQAKISRKKTTKIQSPDVENRMCGGVGGVTGTILLPRPDSCFHLKRCGMGYKRQNLKKDAS